MIWIFAWAAALVYAIFVMVQAMEVGFMMATLVAGLIGMISFALFVAAIVLYIIKEKGSR